MTDQRLRDLHVASRRVREHIIRLAANGGCYLGAALSCADTLVYLYKEVLRIDLNRLTDPARDYLLLSKGHSVPALYGTLVDVGILDEKRLANHLKVGDAVYWHPNRQIPGVEYHSGSLGHLLSVGIGIAIDMRLRQQSSRVFVVLGDGELNEGSIWEGTLVAASLCLDNLVLVIDRNGLQANLPTEMLNPLEPIEEKFEAFHCAVRRIDGHSFADLEWAFNKIPFSEGHPSVVIANTVRGKGVPSIEGRADRWFANLSCEEVDAMLRELQEQHLSTSMSESILVK